MLTPYHFKSYLLTDLPQASTTMELTDHPDLLALCEAVAGDYTWLVVRNSYQFEEVKVIGCTNGVFNIERPNPLDFEKGDCVEFDPLMWNTFYDYSQAAVGQSTAIQEIYPADSFITIESSQEDCGRVGIGFNEDQLSEAALDFCSLPDYNCPGALTSVPICHNGQMYKLNYNTYFTASGQSTNGCGDSGTEYVAGYGIDITNGAIAQRYNFEVEGLSHLGVTYDRAGNAIDIDQNFRVPIGLSEGTYYSLTVDADGYVISGDTTPPDTGGTNLDPGYLIEFNASGAGGTTVDHARQGVGTDDIIKPFLTGTFGGLEVISGHVVGAEAFTVDTDTPSVIGIDGNLVNHLESPQGRVNSGVLTFDKFGHMQSTAQIHYGAWVGQDPPDDNIFDYAGSSLFDVNLQFAGWDSNRVIITVTLTQSITGPYGIWHDVIMRGNTIDTNHNIASFIRNKTDTSFEIVAWAQSGGDGMSPHYVSVEIKAPV